jgi:aspartyl aminopeptidase
VGGAYVPGNGFTVVGAHTDSPCLKIKPKTCSVKSGALVLNTFGYGGGLWHTWFDRDLGLAGRAIVKTASGGLETKLVCIDRPIARIPNLAIHLTQADERDKFGPNLHEHCKAIISMNAAECQGEETSSSERLHPCLTGLIGAEIGVPAEDIVDLELQLIDTQKAVIGGLNNDLLYCGRLDNLCSSYQCARALIDGAADEVDPLAAQSNIRLALLFDHEEVGSNSTTGAGSSLFMDTLTLITSRLLQQAGGDSKDMHGLLFRSLRKSYCVSIDMAHALHPNYTAKHDPEMAPKIHQGLVIKTNANQRYATNAVSASLFR